ncbi:MAG: DUF3592 domain-containing protein [Candidatus Heimdallarchaeota archaeon]|nr:MAG: DUF3592 domain-containing protein [Candidatus Heimdallarchaeota archaeon]
MTGEADLTIMMFGMAIIGFFAALVCSKFVSNSKKKLEESKTWPSVKGKVEQLEPSIAGWEEVRVYSTNIIYSYNFAGRNYKSKVIRLKGGDTQADEKRYPKGKIVDVYVNPQYPKEAVLETGGSLNSEDLLFLGCSIFGFIMSFICLLIGLVLVLF